MKNRILLSFLLLPALCSAQKVELALGGGVSGNDAANGDMPYKTTKVAANYVGNAKAFYNAGNHWQFGLEASVSELSGTTDHSYSNYITHVNIAGSDNKRIVYAQAATALMLVANYKINLNKYDPGKSYFYAGVSSGGTETFNSHKLGSNEAYVAPQGGGGFVAGVQLGYTHYFTDRWGFDVQAAVRYYGLDYTAYIPHGLNGDGEARLQYGVLAVPVTVGIRYKLFQGRNGQHLDNGRQHKSGGAAHRYW